MSSDPESPHATQLRNHWYWRPGWNPNRRFYTWHLTFEGQEQLHRLVSTCQDALVGVPGFDLIPLRWLHLTVQGVGFANEVPSDQICAIADAASARLMELPPIELTFHRPVIRTEAIALPPAPQRAIAAIRDAIRDGIADVWTTDIPETNKRFEPHVSLAYVNMDSSASRARQALASVQSEPVQVMINKASLIVLRRTKRLYQWEEFASAPLGVST